MKNRVDTQVDVTNKAHGIMRDHAASAVYVRDFEPVISDEPPSRGGNNSGPSPLEYMLVALCACINVSTGRMAQKIRFVNDNLETFAEGDLDTRGRKWRSRCPCALSYGSGENSHQNRRKRRASPAAR